MPAADAQSVEDLLNDPTTSNEPPGATPPAKVRQDTPTEMFVQEVHGEPDDEDDDGGRTGVARPLDDDDDDGGRTGVAAAPTAGEIIAATRKPKPSYGPAADGDDNPTSILDLDALTEQQEARRKAQAPPATTPPPTMGAAAAALPDLAPPSSPALGSPLGGAGALGAPIAALAAAGGLPPGATDTMRLDLDSVEGAPAPRRANIKTEKLTSEAFDPSRISLVDAPGGPPAPALQDGLETSVQQRPALGAVPLPPPPLHAQAPTTPIVAPTSSGKPDWQKNVDQGIAAATAQTREATARFLVWYRSLQPNEQIAFVAGTVLGFVIVVMLFILWIR